MAAGKMLNPGTQLQGNQIKHTNTNRNIKLCKPSEKKTIKVQKLPAELTACFFVYIQTCTACKSFIVDVEKPDGFTLNIQRKLQKNTHFFSYKTVQIIIKQPDPCIAITVKMSILYCLHENHSDLELDFKTAYKYNTTINFHGAASMYDPRYCRGAYS